MEYDLRTIPTIHDIEELRDVADELHNILEELNDLKDEYEDNEYSLTIEELIDAIREYQ